MNPAMFFARSLSLAIFFFAVLFPGRIFAQNVPPVVSDSIPDATYFAGAPAALVPLEGYFSDPDTSVVRLTTVLGEIDIALYDEETPLTVANFKNYIDSGRYFPLDPTTQLPAPLFFHRSVAGFVIQSGGYAGTVNPAEPANVQPTAILTFPPVPNEPGISNTRGTIAMAKLDGQPDSANSQWYINLGDNGGPPNNLDTNNGGFTVFGRVIRDGMTVVDAIGVLPRFNFGSPFESLPLRNFTSGSTVKPENLVSIPGINYIPALTFTASSAQPGLATVRVSGTNLLITPKAVGNATITVTATDVDGAQVAQSFVVSMIANPVRVANISTRALVGALDAALIGGFIVAGDTPKLIAVRAIGPSLAGAGVGNPLANPALELRDGAGALIASNDNWQDAANAQDLVDLGLAPTEPNESAILTTIPASSGGLGLHRRDARAGREQRRWLGRGLRSRQRPGRERAQHLHPERCPDWRQRPYRRPHRDRDGFAAGPGARHRTVARRRRRGRPAGRPDPYPLRRAGRADRFQRQLAGQPRPGGDRRQHACA